MTEQNPISVRRDGDLAWVRITNPPVNATSLAVRAGLMNAVQEVQGARCAILICAGKSFVAGGDMSEFDRPPEAPHLPDVVQAIEDSGTPFLAVMHGTVLGGGFEIAMGCAWRIAAAGTRFGLPEVNVGLIPGAGGTQRAPRLLGMMAAIDLACRGRLLAAERVAQLGGVDHVFDGDLAEAARAFVADLPPRPDPVSTRLCEPLRKAELENIRAELAKRAKGQKSPLLNLEAVQWATQPFETGQPMERIRHLELRKSSESRALRYAFFAERAVSRPTAAGNAAARDIAKIAVVGGGLMGAGIAAASLSGGLSVTLLERDVEVVSAAETRVHGLIDGAVTRGRLSVEAAEAQKAKVHVTSDYGQAAGSSIAIEAVFEDMGVKQTVFAALDDVMGAETILATNTSYLDPREIFAGISNPSRCVGLHFFSPAHVMKLLEIIALPETTQEVLATSFALGKMLRKVPVLSGICDGFIGNRMLAEYRRLAEYMLADGALPLDIDTVARKIGFPMGPFELQDLTGLQIAWANRQRQAATRNPAQRYVTIGDQLCERVRLGQRSGQGWDDCQGGTLRQIPSDEVTNVILAYSKAQGIDRKGLTAEQIEARILAVLANEGARIVEEGIAETDAAVDMVQLHGYAFPRWAGGPMHMASEVGWHVIAKTMNTLAEESPGSWVLSERVQNTA